MGKKHSTPFKQRQRIAASVHTSAKQQNYEESVVVWLDANGNKADKASQPAFYELRKIANRVETYDDENECISFINAVNDGHVFLIISGAFDERILRRTHALPQISFVYLLCTNREHQNENWIKSYPRVRGTYTDIELICVQLREDITNLLNVSLGIKLMSVPVVENFTAQIHRQEASFMYAQFLKDILLDIPSTNESKREMIDFCRAQYNDNKAQLRLIDEFEKTYVKDRAIWWYSKDCFLYRLLNRALRVQDVDALYKMRYYVQDLHTQIQQQHSRFRERTINVDKLVVYRGYGLPLDQFEALKTKIGGFMSVTSFLSTSEDYTVALGFAFPLIGLSDQVAIILVIEIDIRNCKTPFADVQTQSLIQPEKEILFSMGTVFRIRAIEKNDNGIWIVKLSLTRDQDQELCKLTEHMKKDIYEWSPLASLAKLMMEMGHYDKAEQFHLLLLEDPTVIGNFRSLCGTHTSLGLIYSNMSREDEAIEHYHKSIEILLAHSTSTDFQLSTTYNNLGEIYREKNDYDQALTYYNKALEIHLNSPYDNQNEIGNIYNNIGLVYDAQQNYSQALKWLEKSREIRLKTLPPNHPSLAISYNNISQVQRKQENNIEAIENLNETLRIELASRQADHPTLATTYNNLAITWYNLGNYQEALQHMEKAYKIQSYTLPPNHPHVLQSLQWITGLKQQIAESRKVDETIVNEMMLHNIRGKVRTGNLQDFRTCPALQHLLSTSEGTRELVVVEIDGFDRDDEK